MKTTLELPEATLREARALASARGISMKRLLAEALEEQLQVRRPEDHSERADPPWMEGYGVLADLAGENQKILKAIEEEFETVLPNELP